jgi:hypothetical protein
MRAILIRSWSLCLLGIVLPSLPAASSAEPAPFGPAEFSRLHAMLKPQAGESRWMEVEWYPSIWEARRKAAAEGKPLFIWAGSGGAPAAGC